MVLHLLNSSFLAPFWNLVAAELLLHTVDIYDLYASLIALEQEYETVINYSKRRTVNSYQWRF